LQEVSQPASNENGFRTKGPIKLTGWQWSATTESSLAKVGLLILETVDVPQS